MAHEASTHGHGGHPLRRLLPATTERTQIELASLHAPSADSDLGLRIRAACNACRTRKSKARDFTLDYYRAPPVLLLTM